MTDDDSRPQRRTRQRAAVNAAVDRFDGFRTAQQVHEQLRRDGESVGLTTVYRTLQSMAGSGEVDTIRTADGEAAYRRCSSGHHHHLVCRGCGRTVEITGEAVEDWANRVATSHGFRDSGHDLEIYGTCSDC